MLEDQEIDHVSAALADPTHPTLLVALRDGGSGVTELADPLPTTFAGVSRHIGVSEAAGVAVARLGPGGAGRAGLMRIGALLAADAGR